MWRILAKSTLIVGSAQETFNKDGAQDTFSAITDQARQFHERDLYVNVLGHDCVVQTHARARIWWARAHGSSEIKTKRGAVKEAS